MPEDEMSDEDRRAFDEWWDNTPGVTAETCHLSDPDGVRDKNVLNCIKSVQWKAVAWALRRERARNAVGGLAECVSDAEMQKALDALVYYNEEHDNFYYRHSGKGVGQERYLLLKKALARPAPAAPEGLAKELHDAVLDAQPLEECAYNLGDNGIFDYGFNEGRKAAAHMLLTHPKLQAPAAEEGAKA